MTNTTKISDSDNSSVISEAMRDTAQAALEEAKGEDVQLLDVRQLTDVTDYMVVASGTSDRHVKALAERVRDAMLEAGWKPLGVEGEEVKDWILLDYVDVVVHVMRTQARQHYDLESLWDENLGTLLKSQREEGL